ncbi:hypothetical protein ACHAWF_013000, partial [Thalassiosira exigua]
MASSSSSSSGAAAEEAPANVRVLVRVRPLGEGGGGGGGGGGGANNGVLRIHGDGDGRPAPVIDFGVPGSSSSTRAAAAGGADDATDSSTSNRGTRGVVSVVDPGGGGTGSAFTYDAAFGPSSTQSELFDSVRGIVDAVSAGYNGTVVAYGQTGSGKTHTIFGNGEGPDDAGAGLVQRSVDAIFRTVSERSLISPTSASAAAASGGTVRTTTKASFLEIYNERTYDLLAPPVHDDVGNRFGGGCVEEDRGLPVRECDGRVYVEGLTEREVRTAEEALDVLRAGMDGRRVAATNMNRVSSRSHAVFSLTIKSELSSSDGIDKVRTSKFTLVDLAGSERQKSTAADGERLKEASMINGSLLCLGQVINALADRSSPSGGGGGGGHKHVPFRDSKLTFLLRDSWGGNSKTCLVATVTPSPQCLGETISTLKFAQRAKLVKNAAKVNEDACGSVAALKVEVARLRAALERKEREGRSSSSTGEVGAAQGDDEKLPASGHVAAAALRGQNVRLGRKVRVLEDVADRRTKQATSLKRKLAQEALLVKCKERRIAYLSGRAGSDEGEAALREEMRVLKERLEERQAAEEEEAKESGVEYLLKIKELQAKIEGMEEDVGAAFEGNEKRELQASLVELMDERDALNDKVATMAEERNTEIDSIINEVSRMERGNDELRARLAEKEGEVAAGEDRVRERDARIDALGEELKNTLDDLADVRGGLEAEREASTALQTSVEEVRREADEARAAAKDAAKAEMTEMAVAHDAATTALNAKIDEVQKGLDKATDDNKSLTKRLEEASEDVASKRARLEELEAEKAEALKQLEQCREEHAVKLERFAKKEEALTDDLAKSEEAAKSILTEKTEAIADLAKLSSENASLSGEVEALKAELDVLRQRTEQDLDELREKAAALEDEIEWTTHERDDAEERLAFAGADL